VGGQPRQQPQLGGGQRGDPDGPAADRVELSSQLLGLAGEDAQVGPPSEDVAGLAQHHPGAGAIVQGQVGAAQLQQGLDGEIGQGVGEQGSQASGPPELCLGAWHLAPVQGCPGHHRMDQAAGDIVVQPPIPNDAVCLVGEGGGLRPVLVVHRHQGSLGQGDRGRGQRTGLGGDLDGVGQDRVGPVVLTGQQVADPL
jgi:hypothetical protein